jgi:hypothetical protein
MNAGAQKLAKVDGAPVQKIGSPKPLRTDRNVAPGSTSMRKLLPIPIERAPVNHSTPQA